MTVEFHKKLSAFSWITLTGFLTLEILVRHTELLKGFVQPIHINYLVTTAAINILFWGVYSLVYQKRNFSKIKDPFTYFAIFFGLLFTGLNFAEPISNLNMLSKLKSTLEPELLPEVVVIAHTLTKNYLQIISIILGVLFIVYLLFIWKLLKSNAPPNHPLKRDGEPAGVSE